MKCIIIIIAQCITLHLIAMDRHQERNRQAYCAQLTQRIKEKELEIEDDKHKRYIAEFVTFFAARTIDQPYAALITIMGIAGICFLTERIDEAIEVKDYFKSEMRRAS